MTEEIKPENVPERFGGKFITKKEIITDESTINETKNTEEKTEFTKPLSAWMTPDGSIEIRISNGNQTFVLHRINPEGKLEISDEFAEAIMEKVIPKGTYALIKPNNSEMPIGETNDKS